MTTDIEISSKAATAVTTYSDNAMDRLGRWLQQADAVFAIAERICETSFVPTAYRRKPAEAAAAMLAGAELGFDPMASLRAFDNINGTPAPKAITQRAVVLGAGHDIETIEQSATRAVVRGRRKGATEWQTATWDIARAMRLPQFKTNANYQHNPEAMLVARATSEVCRWVAPDAVMGMPYSAEEISDHPELAPSPVVRRLTVADLDEPRVHPSDGRELAKGYMADPDAGRKAAEFPGYIDPTTLVVEHVTRDQQKRMFALWGELGYGDDSKRADRLAKTAKFIGVESIESSNDLTFEQANVVIARLLARKEQVAAAGGDPE
jgi:hypothetical protein